MSTEHPNDPAQAAALVRELLGVIEHLSHGSLDPDWPSRFVSIREGVDVGPEVNPVVARAEAFLRAAAGASEITERTISGSMRHVSGTQTLDGPEK